MGEKTGLIIAIIGFVVLLYFVRGFGPELISPGQEVIYNCVSDSDCNVNEVCKSNKCADAFPVNDKCGNKDVLNYGKPSYHLDSEMDHMIGMSCSNNNQCNAWPPDAAIDEGVSVVCCMNEGWCYN